MSLNCSKIKYAHVQILSELLHYLECFVFTEKKKKKKSKSQGKKDLSRKNLENPKCLTRERHEMSPLRKIYVTGETPSGRPPL